MTEGTDRDAETLADLLVAWYGFQESGEPVDPRHVCKDHPELLEEFLRIVERDGANLRSVRTDRSVGTALTPGERIDEFEIVTLLGAGGRGDVYLARQQSLSRLVALKVLKHAETANPAARRRLLAEAEIAASLEHRNVVPIYAVGETDEHAYIAMKWLSGPSLDRVPLPLDPKEIARIGAVAAGALHAAHLAGVVHRDVKPGNIVFDGDEPCVLDFGLARAIDDVTESVDGRTSGTLPYMSPEQLQSPGGIRGIDGRADVFSLGATLHELATGRRVFDGESAGSVVQRVLFGEIQPMVGVDRDFETILLRALERRPADRFMTAAEFADELERYRTGHPILSRRIGFGGRLWRLARRHPRASTAVATCGALAIGLGVAFARQSWDARSVFRGRLDAVETALEERAVVTARRDLDAIALQYPKHDDIRRLSALVGAAERFEELLDRIQARPRALRADDLVKLRDDIVASVGGAGPPGYGDAWRAANAFLNTIVGSEDHNVEALPWPRFRAALIACREGRPSPWALPNARGGADEHLFVSLVMRAASLTTEEREAEIARGKRIDPTHVRLKLQTANIGVDRGDKTVADLLDVLARDRRSSRFIARMRIALARRTEDPTNVRERLAHFEDTFDSTVWSPVDYSVVAAAYHGVGDAKEGDRVLTAGVATWPRESHLALLRLKHRITSGRVPLSEAPFRPFAEDPSAAIRDEAALWRLIVRSEHRSGDLRALARDALKLANETKDDRIRAEALGLQANAVWHMSGRMPGRSRVLLTRAYEIASKAVSVHATRRNVYLAVQIAHNLLRSVEKADQPLAFRAVHAGRRWTDRFERDYWRGARIDQRMWVLCCACEFVCYAGDFLAGSTVLNKIDALGDPIPEAFAQRLEELRALAKR